MQSTINLIQRFRHCVILIEHEMLKGYAKCYSAVEATASSVARLGFFCLGGNNGELPRSTILLASPLCIVLL